MVINEKGAGPLRSAETGCHGRWPVPPVKPTLRVRREAADREHNHYSANAKHHHDFYAFYWCNKPPTRNKNKKMSGEFGPCTSSSSLREQKLEGHSCTLRPEMWFADNGSE